MMAKILTIIVLFITITIAQPYFKDEPIFAYQAQHVHASSIVETAQGDLLVCWFHGSGERTADDVVIQGSRLKQGTGTWEPVFLMADTPGFPDCNPVLHIDEQKRLWLFWVVVQAHRWEQSILKYRLSEKYDQNGPPVWQWQDIINLKPGSRSCMGRVCTDLCRSDYRSGERSGEKTNRLDDAHSPVCLTKWTHFASPVFRWLLSRSGGHQ
jgi:hypothetical protein